jgi:hypothetical protein
MEDRAAIYVATVLAFAAAWSVVTWLYWRYAKGIGMVVAVLIAAWWGSALVPQPICLDRLS